MYYTFWVLRSPSLEVSGRKWHFTNGWHPSHTSSPFTSPIRTCNFRWSNFRPIRNWPWLELSDTYETLINGNYMNYLLLLNISSIIRESPMTKLCPLGIIHKLCKVYCTLRYPLYDVLIFTYIVWLIATLSRIRGYRTMKMDNLSITLPSCYDHHLAECTKLVSTH